MQQISPFLGYVNNRFKSLGYGGIGQISSRGAPLYLGRWVDKRTGKARAFPKIDYVYDPLDYEQTLVHHVFSAVNKWNSFARAE